MLARRPRCARTARSHAARVGNVEAGEALLAERSARVGSGTPWYGIADFMYACICARALRVRGACERGAQCG